MAGTSQRRMNGSWVRLVLGTLLCMLISHSGVLAQDVTDTADGADYAITIITVPPDLAEFLERGDGEPTGDITDDTAAADPGDVPATSDATDPEADDGPDAAGDPDAIAPTAASEGVVTNDPQLSIDIKTIFEVATVLVPGDVGPEAIEPTGTIECVDREALKDRDAVKLRLKNTSSCEETMAKIREVMGDLCGPDCDIKIYQEDTSAQIIVSGDDVEADAKGMAGKFRSQGIKEKLGVVEATPRWGKHPPTVLVALLLTGLLLAAALIGGYCLRNHRGQQTKSAKLAEESFPVDQENQGNTLVSVAPLHPQEPQEKPSANGESPEGVKTEPPPPTNGHSAAKSPVADTEL